MHERIDCYYIYGDERTIYNMVKWKKIIISSPLLFIGKVKKVQKLYKVERKPIYDVFLE
jgi:hypothetical protein